MKDKFNWRNHIRDIYLFGAITSFGVGGLVAFLGNSLGNPILITLGFAGLAGGVMLFRSWRGHGTVRHIKKEGEAKEQLPANSLNIYEKLVEFAHVDETKGQTVKCVNDNQFYNLHLDSQNGKGLIDLQLPDDDDKERYYDPAEFANPVTMPSNKKYFTWSASTIQKISVGLMVVLIAGEMIALIAVGG